MTQDEARDDTNAAGPSVDAAEIDRFARLAADWWNPRGSMRALHRINPTRLGYVRERIGEQFSRGTAALDGLSGLSILDIGCGAGLVAEPLARLGAGMVGIDAAATTIAIARLHAADSGLAIDYRCAAAEDLAAAGERFDVVLALEVIEHVVDPEAFVATCAQLAKPGGLVILSTLNRTLKAYALAIVGAEYVLRWLPRGTHDWDKFIRPAEIEAAAAVAGLGVRDLTGMIFDPLHDGWRLSRDTDVNYFVTLAAD